MSLALNYVDGPEEGTLWPPTLLPESEGLHTLICYFRTDTVLENTLTDVRKHWRRKEQKSLCVLCKIIVVKFVIALDPFKDTKALRKEKGDWVRGAHVLSWGLRMPTQPSTAGAGVALSLLFLRVFQRVSGRLWRGGAHNSAQSPCPFLSILWVKKGSAGFWRGKGRALHTINPLARSLPHLGTDHRGTRGFMLSVTHTDWHKKELLGLFRAGV